jgi:hypothetical protein
VLEVVRLSQVQLCQQFDWLIAVWCALQATPCSPGAVRRVRQSNDGSAAASGKRARRLFAGLNGDGRRPPDGRVREDAPSSSGGMLDFEFEASVGTRPAHEAGGQEGDARVGPTADAGPEPTSLRGASWHEVRERAQREGSCLPGLAECSRRGQQRSRRQWSAGPTCNLELLRKPAPACKQRAWIMLACSVCLLHCIAPSSAGGFAGQARSAVLAVIAGH